MELNEKYSIIQVTGIPTHISLIQSTLKETKRLVSVVSYSYERINQDQIM